MSAASSMPGDLNTGHRGHQSGFHTILVVDDELGIRSGCQRILTAEGHHVLLAETAEIGMDILTEHPETDLVLVDLRMPGKGGMWFLGEAARQMPETVCVVITAYATLESAIEATRLGAYEFVTKPFTPDDLIRVTNNALERAHLMREHNRLRLERESRMLELATEQSRLKVIIDCMSDGVLVINADGQLVLKNPAALRVLPNITPGVDGQLIDEVLEPEELRDLITEASQRGVRLSGEIDLNELPGDGWVLASVAPVVDVEGEDQAMGTVSVLRDITELKKLEQVKAQFVNMVAHELRAPLSAVTGYLSLMRQGVVTDPARQTEMLERSEQRIKALLDLVDDLLNVSRMEAGTVRREITGQSLNAIVSDVIELMQPTAQTAQVRLINNLSVNLPAVEADREELARLFTNLVSNGVKYNRPGGEVRISAEETGAFVKIEVADTGIGISAEGQTRLFSEFFREKRPETTYVTGTGLGLSIVKRIVDFYHGRIEASSELGVGTTFRIWLPCQYEANPTIFPPVV